MKKFYPSLMSNTVSASKPSKAFRLLLMVLFFVLIPVISFGQSPLKETSPGNYSFTVPPGVTSITVEAWGAGGAGGASSSDEDGGGGGGAYAYKDITVVPGVTYAYTVGKGGTSLGNNRGTPGGDSYFNSITFLKAGGGQTNLANNTGGAGGVFSGTGVTGSNGGTGGRAASNSGGGGGGCGNATYTGRGGDGNYWNGGSGGLGGNNGGNGGAGATRAVKIDGVDGFLPGGGGGGDNDTSGNSSSGKGGDGQIMITWTCPANAGTLSGNQYICTSGTNTTTFASTVLGGTWSSSSTLVATVNPSSGVVTAAGAGTATITYTVASTGCVTPPATRIVTVNNVAISSQSTATQTKCISTPFTAITVTATGVGLAYQWYVNAANSNSGGTSLVAANGAQTNSYTPQSTAAGTLYYYCIVSGTCGTAVTSALSGAFITNPNVAISSQSTATQTKCISTPFTAITVTATGVGLSYQWYSNAANSNSGGTSLLAANGAQTFSYTPQSTVAGTLYYYCVVSGVCTPPATSSAVMVTVNALPSTPVATNTDATCALPTGSITITSPVPAAGITYTITGTSLVVEVTNDTGEFTGLAAGTYNVTAKNAGCVSLPSADVVIKPVLTNIWNGTLWSIFPKPTIDQNLEFAGTYTSNSSDPIVEGCSCQVNLGKSVTIKEGHTLKIYNGVTILGTGSLTFENNASLVQINEDPSINWGNITYIRNTKPVKRYDYTYWSSPVASQTLYNLSPNTLYDKYYGYNPNTGWELHYNGAHVMRIGEGYIIRAPQYFSITNAAVDTAPQFIGVPNNGLQAVPVIAGKYYLLGNPYPSAIDADKFLDANKNVLDGTLYFWTHNTQIGKGVSKPGTGLYAYSGDDYASYNFTGGVGIANGNLPGGIVLNEIINNKPSGKIASGQGFFTTSKALGNVLFTNEMRVEGGSVGNNSQFFKTIKPNGKTANTIEKNRVWLNLTNTQGAFKQTLIGYLPSATNEYDSLFDGESFDGNPFVDFYSVNQDRNFVIQGRALPFDENDQVPLGYRTTINGEFTINIDEVDGLLINQAVFIEDKLANATFDLKKGNYTFTTAPGTFNDRFVLKYSNKTLSLDTIEKEDGILAFYSNNYNTLIIHNNSVDTTVNAVSLFNMTGQNIGVWNVRDSEQTNIQIPLKKISSGIYILKAKTIIGESSKKIIVN